MDLGLTMVGTRQPLNTSITRNYYPRPTPLIVYTI